MITLKAPLYEICAMEVTFSRRHRGQCGAALAEGAASLIILTVGTVCAVLLLTNAGMSTYYKGKLGFIANQCAVYAASLNPGDDLKTKTETYAKTLVAGMGFPTQGCRVKLSEQPVEDRSGVKVTISLSGLQLFGGGDILPTKIAMEDSALATRSGTPNAFIWMNRNPKMSAFLIPVVRVPPNGPGVFGLPVYSP